ncbi:hypothetical protein [Rhizobium leguminosarum]|uniref:hypothetical protein n=1 Tax=Rhizobium leguminosarum TaxID=384 RepID=UPI0010119C7B|nr:hypothetical protein [Rhizobium leguminosarum]
MRINLRKYATELSYWIDALKPFIGKESHRALSALKDQLENGRDNLRPAFDWKLDRPIVTKEAERYDGPDKTPHKVKVGWQFESTFESDGQSKKTSLWNIKKMVTHIRIYNADDDSEILHFHHDLKNREQLGPHVHMQFSEHYLKNKGRIPIAVPRFPITAILPTDCFDLVLAEFFPFEWPKSQAGSHGLVTLRSNQRTRLIAITEALQKQWEASPKLTPVSATQNCYMPDLQIA